MNTTEKEIWKVVSSNPGYEISTLGNVRNKETMQILKLTTHGLNKGRKNPYYRVELKYPRKKYLVHRLVAEAFLDNPNNYDQINHKDNNGINNNVSNLEWCDIKYNIRYSQLKPILKIKNNKVIDEYGSLTEAAEKTNSDIRLISAVCLGKRKTHNGFNWEYKNPEDNFIKRHNKNE